MKLTRTGPSGGVLVAVPPAAKDGRDEIMRLCRAGGRQIVINEA